MMDVSDGLLIDADRIATTSGVALTIDLDAVPLSAAAVERAGTNRDARLNAATAGDDYALLLTSSLPLPAVHDRLTPIGKVTSGAGLSLFDHGVSIPLPTKLGWLHS
jgi:thiamine-monophosphate kinase